MQSWTLAGAFDAGHIRGGTPDWSQELNFHQLEISGHAAQLESDYTLFREEFGLAQFRDGSWMARSFPEPGEYDWTYLDRLAAISRQQVTLSICHYEWPVWATEDDLFNGRVVEETAAFAEQIARRYRGCFAGYIPVVESGYWTAMMTDWGRWWPATQNGPNRRWWDMYAVVGRLLVAIARGLRRGDPDASIALSEPWAWHPHVSLFDQSRPFQTLLGRPDRVAERETGTYDWGGQEDLLDTIGLNFYNNWGVEHGWPLSRLLLKARAQFPDKRIVMGETGNCHFSDCHTVAGWLELIDEQVEEANRQGARIEAVTWAPVLTLGDFDWGKPAPGAWVTWDLDDPARKRHWNPATAREVRRFTEGSIRDSLPLPA
jgi:hypothetical protein